MKTTDTGWEKEFCEQSGTYTNEYGYVHKIPNYEKVIDFIQHIAKEEYSKGYHDGFKQGRFEGQVLAKEEYERGRKDERDAWLAGNRCNNCGDSNLGSGHLADMCGKCFEEA